MRCLVAGFVKVGIDLETARN